MTEVDRVLVEIVANPDDDAPRLVWADLVGGERGELVVIQCDLARGGLAPRETAKRRKRERTLLVKHGVAWAGALADDAVDWRFRRGFIEAARFDLADERTAPLTEHPLLASLWLQNPDAHDAFRHVPAIAPRGVFFEGVALDVFAERGALRDLRSFGISGAGTTSPAVVNILASCPIEQLWLRDYRLENAELEALLAMAPKLTALELVQDHLRNRYRDVEEMLDVRIIAKLPLRALRLGVSSSFVIDAVTKISTIERLAIELDTTVKQIDLEPLQRLHTLEIGGEGSDAMLDALARCSLPALRVLRLRRWPNKNRLGDVIARYRSQLELVDVRGYVWGDLVDRDFAGEALDEPVSWGWSNEVDEPLLHAGASTMLERATPCLRSAPGFSLAIMNANSDDQCTVPPIHVDRVLTLGGVRRPDIFVPNAPGPAEICWVDDHHEIVDTGFPSGISVNDQPCTRSILHDGDKITYGEAEIYYFVGDGAHERAHAALT